MLIILTGKTASGKDTVAAKLLEKIPSLKKVLTTTSRTPRPGEQNGIDYNFVSGESFQQKIDSGDLIEYVEYGGNFYGTEKSQIDPNKDLIWKIDPSRAGKIRELISSKLIVIYLTAPDSVILERLKKRGLSEDQIKKRVTDDQKFWEEYKDSYDHVIENIPGRLEQTVEQVINFVKS